MGIDIGLSVELARFIRGTRYADLPPDVVAFTKLCILDWLSSALAGEKKVPVQMIRSMVEELGGHAQATLVSGGKSSVANAALLNGAASHIVELDDIHKASIIHAATVVVPAALAIGEWKCKNGRDLITAVAIGYEVCFRVGEAVSPSHYFYWHNTATCGTFGSAAAAAKLLDLSEEQIVHALGNAGTQAAGLWEFIEDGAMSKQLHTGKAAMNGLIAALLAEKGFTGASQILEGRRGFFKAMSEQYDATRITADLGKKFKIVENSFKIHASCRHTHHAIDLILDILKEQLIQPDQVKGIRVKTYQVALTITDNIEPKTIYAAKFSLQYCTALAFIKKSAGLYDFNEETLWDPSIRGFMNKIEVLTDPEIDAAYPEKWGAQVEVVLCDGQTIVRKTDYPKGDPELPVTEELAEKFRSLTRDRSSEVVEGYIERVMDLEHMVDVTSFFAKERGGN
ncbi:MmgE/PrpD family protein [Paenibacillus alginolyticus]|uniref:MmgE/PrpD family protein n=1 Tax=Paenibacillus alginolyticus TaxID=59839 RepID=UPI001C268AEF|nr:MmgE/PrpD family protein [Paenibacillus frigoriresistens]